MKSFQYGDEKIRDVEILIAAPSMAVGVGILLLPKQIAVSTMAADGWISIVLAGMTVMLVTWMITKTASRFPRQHFLTYAASLVSKPVAIVFTFVFSVISLLVTAYVVRRITDIAEQYLFDRTPMEAVALTFLLVVVYAVAGSRAGLFRLNMMFFPFICVITLVVLAFNIRFMDAGNLLPVFQTDVTGYLKGIRDSWTAFAGIGMFFFYIMLVERPQKTPAFAAIGMGIAIFFMCCYF